ncbi:M23 family metallopeptidase [Corynebacterium sp.]|uniref:M23 family metallopeptidase n=1 Tax=Corynebacterium sp. TaxID=1720 RepID=UPI0026DB2CCB|nr:M23 family metallopeptidase [Corynebacterium sp.]MDO4610175.1 M23 family metallopeptidase [Corynebacterium sp.]
MATQGMRRKGGAHRRRKQTSAGRLAVATLTATAVTLAGHGAAGASERGSGEMKKADARDLSAQQARAADVPTLVTAQDLHPVINMSAQLATALQYNKQRMARERAAFGPSVSIPAIGVLTSGFGPRWGSFHYGVDIANVTNTPILAVMDGTVIDSGPAQGYGQWIRIRHDDGAVSVYGHLETLGVQVGERVLAGEQIGGMGNRGFSTGTHLHFEIHPDGETPVDPVTWFISQGLNLQ